MPHTHSQPDQLWQPTTFLERGVAVPFTTPVLGGARARPAARGVELVVPHPAGARGVYIMAWSELENFCTPTLHDLRLTERLAALPAVTPRDLRAAARAVAAEGVAGRGPRDAALAAAALEDRERLAANIALLRALVRQTTGEDPPLEELDRQARMVLLRAAPTLGRPAPVLARHIEDMAAIYAPLGVGDTRRDCRAARLIEHMERTRAAMKTVVARGAGHAGMAAALVGSAVEVTLTLARRSLAEGHQRAEDMLALLAAWVADPAGVARILTRTEWLLDGWEQICAVWQLAEDAARRAAVIEMAMMVPCIPREADSWLGIAVDESERQRLRRLVHGYEDWRTGCLVLDLVARNERIRALAA